ncbi:MAG: asparaginase domain-containing protein [Bacteroidota bacterium]
MKIVFIQTGGTIDKDYPHTTGGWAFEFGAPAVERILKQLNPSFAFEIRTAFQKDSLEITASDRHALAALINAHPNERFLITHGTDTLLETAAVLDELTEGKLIVLTGAMRPERFSNSDAPVNLGVAIGALNTLQAGVYIAMSGLVCPFREMQRDERSGRFYRRP